MAVLVTGGLGHIGSWVSARLIKEGKKVIILDKNASRFDQVAIGLLKKARSSIVLESGSVTDREQVLKLFAKYRNEIEGIIHIAALCGVPEFNEKPLESVELNVMGTVQLLEAARTHDIKKFVYVSSGAIYGDQEGPLREGVPPSPGDLYGATKLAGEQLTIQYGDTFGIQTSCARVYFVYGPGRMPSGMYPIYQWVFAPLEGITGLAADRGADQLIDFTHVYDTSQGILKLYLQDKPKSRVYNISSGKAIRLGEAVQMVKEVLGKETGIRLGPGKAAKRGAPLDITLAVQEIGYRPRFTEFREGIKHYYEWIMKFSREFV